VNRGGGDRRAAPDTPRQLTAAAIHLQALGLTVCGTARIIESSHERRQRQHARVIANATKEDRMHIRIIYCGE
jgi:hypothetical protein